MGNRAFRSMRLICCDTCSQEWFGALGEEKAREHAAKTRHQVRIEYLVRETLNEVSALVEPMPAEQVVLSANEREQSRQAALARLAADGVPA